MNRSKKICVLLAVLLAACLLTFCVSRYSARREQIRNSDEVVLELAGEDVTSLSWEYGGETLAFHRDETWLYDGDEAFPVSEEKIHELLEQFASLRASFVIEDAADFGQYGLDEPVCTIEIGTGEKIYEILLGSYSEMDQERYVSTGDGNVYLVPQDPLEAFALELKDMIQNDEIPAFDTVAEIAFAGSQNYTAVYTEENTVTYSADDVYFVENGGEGLPLDTENVDGYIQTVRALGLTDYVSYHAADGELASYGLDNPQLTVTMQYTAADGESGEEETGTFVLHISRDPEELAKDGAETKDSGLESGGDSQAADGEEEITAYARVGESRIVYQITGTEYRALMAASCDDLRHRELVWADTADILQVDISLEGEDYVLTTKEADDGPVWYYGDEELETSGFERALTSLTAVSFTDEQPDGREEISLTVHTGSENQPEVRIGLYRYNGSRCLAVVDGKPAALVSREAAVDLIEAVNAIVLD